MNRLIKFYNQNRHTIWIFIITIIAVISIIQILNKIVNEENMQEVVDKTMISNSINKNYSVITGQEIKSETSIIIDQFINYCNNQQIEKAYELLSDECKNILYPTRNDFEKKYHNKIFTEKKTYLYQSWIANYDDYTYKVDYVDDMLATGTASKTSITDYYTVVKNGDEYKLNINRFIKSEELNKTTQKNDIIITIKEKRSFMDYEMYDLEVINDTDNEITLDNLKYSNTVYIQDNNEQEYYWLNNEISPNDVIISSGNMLKIKIKFEKKYDSLAESKKIFFSDVTINDGEKIMIEIPM